MNDERPIEKLLRRYAKKRRAEAGAPVKLHPATRRLLQGEVAREYCKTAPGDARASFAQLMKGWLPRLAWAVPLFVLVAVGLWSLLDQPESKQLALGPMPGERTLADESRAAKVEQREPESLTLTPDARRSTAGEAAPVEFSATKTVPPPPVAIPVRAPDQAVVSLDSAVEQKVNSARDGDNDRAQADKLGIATSAASARTRLAGAPTANRVNTRPAAPPTETAATLQTNRALDLAYAAKQQELTESTARSFDANELPSAAALREIPGPVATLARNDNLERDQAQTYSQSFANLAPESLKQKTTTFIAPQPLSPVLANFRVEQTGRQLRVVDSDGSLYLGETDAAPEFWGDVGGKKDQAVQLNQRDGKRNQLAATAASVPSPPPQSNFYRVAGTNRTLNQAVEFTWSFVELTNMPVLAKAEKIGAELNKDAKKLPTQYPVQLQNSFITGRAHLETGKAIEINAVPITP